ncbi:hypothetical protein [Flavobacterium branchiicola]|uniref:DUF3300 domain-containing protein n=1 Tax=Flavobacterium branchiicola TaxID=1114875 RepID=A0ABV9PCS7_9FLAO|nr:hypothetical protein [Flavobacterium branchiicola]MBS7254556.1 hypothetical protein [Flavobacterium branchiicola]
MKKILFLFLVVGISLTSPSVFSQAEEDTEPPLGLPGDNLDLYAVLALFQKSKTIEDFEKKLNLKETGINNLDLNLDKKVDFIKVVTNKKDNSYTFVLQVAVSKSENQDVAVILVDKDKNGKVSLQIVGDEDLYGKNYVIEPKKDVAAVTANPAYKGDNPVTVSSPATTVIIEQAPIVQYVYSPAYVPYYPPYYYGYYPPYFAAFTVLAVGIYRHNHWYHGGHYGYHGGHYGGHNNIVINNRNSINHYNSNRSRSNTVARNNNGGRYGNSVSNRATNTGVSNRAGAGVSDRASTGNRASTGVSNRASTGTSNRASAGTSDRSSNRGSSASRPSAGTSDRSFSSPSSSNRSSSNFNSGGRTRSGGGGGFSGGGGFGGGGGGRRR